MSEQQTAVGSTKSLRFFTSSHSFSLVPSALAVGTSAWCACPVALIIKMCDCWQSQKVFTVHKHAPTSTATALFWRQMGGTSLKGNERSFPSLNKHSAIHYIHALMLTMVNWRVNYGLYIIIYISATRCLAEKLNLDLRLRHVVQHKHTTLGSDYLNPSI